MELLAVPVPSLAVATVPLARLLAFKLVKLAPEIAPKVPLNVPVVMVPSVVILALPVQVLMAVFSTLPSPTWDLVRPVNDEPSPLGVRKVERASVDTSPAPLSVKRLVDVPGVMTL